MKKLLISILFLTAGIYLSAQTVENIRAVPDGDNLKITYRIGGSTDFQFYTVYFTCSMNGKAKFEPKAVIGDVGENIRGGRSFYTIIWDVFEDVEEVINPEIFIRVELTRDETPVPVQTPVNRQLEPVQQEEVKEQAVEQPQEQVPQQKEETPRKEVTETAKTPKQEFNRNSFFGYSGVTGFGTPIGLKFGSLNKWGYYVVPLRVCINKYSAFDYFYGTLYDELDLHFMATAGATRHIVSGGSVYRLHGFAGIGGHLRAEKLMSDYPESYGHIWAETGIVNVIGPFFLSGGLAISFGYTYPVNFIFGAGFAF